jgi:nitrogenase molybdenum-iron protein alpha chain
LIEKETALLERALKPFRPVLRDKRVMLSAGEFRTLATGTLLAELGCKIVALRPFHHDHFAEVEYEKLKEISGDFAMNVANCQPFEEANLIAKLKPDLFLGHLMGNSTASKLGVATHTIYQIGLNYVGHKGVFELARRVARHLRNPAFHRQLGAHLHLPYTDQWMAGDAYRFIAPQKQSVDEIDETVAIVGAAQ